MDRDLGSIVSGHDTTNEPRLDGQDNASAGQGETVDQQNKASSGNCPMNGTSNHPAEVDPGGRGTYEDLEMSKQNDVDPGGSQQMVWTEMVYLGQEECCNLLYCTKIKNL